MGDEGYKICQYCGEEVKEKAVKCRYCRSDLIEQLDTKLAKNDEELKSSEEIRVDEKYEPEVDNTSLDKEVNRKTNRSSKKYLAYYVIGGLLLFSFIVTIVAGNIENDNVNAGLLDPDTGLIIDNDDLPEEVPPALDDATTISNLYNFDSLKNADSFQKRLAKDRINMVYIYNELSLGYWESFLSNISEPNYKTMSSQRYVEHMGEIWSDNIIKNVLPVLIECEDFSKKNANEVWRNDAVKYYFDASIDLSKLKITHMQTVIDYFWSGDEDLLNMASYIEEIIYYSHRELYVFYLIISEALSESNYSFLVGKKVYVNVQDNEALLVKDKPGTNFKTIDKLIKGVELEVAGVEAGEWLFVKYTDNVGSELKGYVNGNHVSTDQVKSKNESSIPSKTQEAEYATQVYVNVDILRLRSGPGTEYEIIDRLEQGTVLKVMEGVKVTQDEIWLRVITPSGKEGWVHGNYVSN